ncbi:hypothetical protein HanIR_Chr09g0427981 [Helianthus annuus]|nr:hypothetical protein HanIR_Chr09g0427981 [Helianthus annuus]
MVGRGSAMVTLKKWLPLMEVVKFVGWGLSLFGGDLSVLLASSELCGFDVLDMGSDDEKNTHN